ncbi:MAG TPA: hypothetical protein DEA08_35425 [Planctomycetes bacterium]|nr:hypothetical protein [Planctomycetota bacterium]
MKHLNFGLSALALSALVLTGCPDPRPSRDPQTIAEIAQLRGELDGIRARLEAKDGGDKREIKALEERINRLERGLKPVTVNLNISGQGIETKGAVDVKQGKAPATQSGGNGATDPGVEADDPETPVKVGRAPKGQKKGVDAWNELRPAQAGEKPNTGGRVRVALSAQPDKLNTYLDNSAVTSYIMAYINETLIEQDPVTFKWKPLLAESWDTEDMLFEILGADPVEGVKFSDAMQKWVKNEGEPNQQVWWKWEVRETAEGKHEVLKLGEHMGKAQLSGDTWTVTARDGSTKTFSKDKVQHVNRGTVFTFKLRKNAKWHDGKPVTADDVVFSLGFVKCEYVDAPSIRVYYRDVRPAEKLDEHTVRIVYATQYFQALEFAGGIYIHPKHIFDPEDLLLNDPKKFGEQFNDHPAHRAPIGSGPYKFKDWQQGEAVTLERVKEGYHSPEKGGYLDEIVWKFITEAQTALAALRAGEIDFLPRLRAAQYYEETVDEAFTSTFVKPQWYIGNFSYIGWNMRKPPFNDPKVRWAMAHACFDVQKFIDTVLHGAATRVAAPQYVFGPMYNDSLEPPAFDPEKARKLLREAGWFDRDGNGVIENADGQEFAFELLMPSGNTTGKQMAAIMTQNLKRLGIKLDTRELEWAVFLTNIKSRAFDACMLGWVQGLESDSFQIWHSSQSENQGSNHVGYVDPQTDKLILDVRKTLDEDERRTLQHGVQQRIYDAQPYLFLYCSPSQGAYRPQFHGVRFIPFRPGYDLRTWYDIDAK